jgi:hypothetical protein
VNAAHGHGRIVRAEVGVVKTLYVGSLCRKSLEAHNRITQRRVWESAIPTHRNEAFSIGVLELLVGDLAWFRDATHTQLEKADQHVANIFGRPRVDLIECGKERRSLVITRRPLPS